MTNPHHIIIAGFGIPGRFISELLDYHGVSYNVIELNPNVVQRCQRLPVILGDVRNEDVLKRAGIERATLFALTVPIEEVVIEATAIAKRLRPDLQIIARVNYTSVGLKTQQAGAQQVVIGEQLIAREFFRLIESGLSTNSSSNSSVKHTTTEAAAP